MEACSGKEISTESFFGVIMVGSWPFETQAEIKSEGEFSGDWNNSSISELNAK